jgi:hypothetical protein
MGKTFVPGLGEVSEDQLAEQGEAAQLFAGGGRAAHYAAAPSPPPEELGVSTVFEARPLGGRDFLKAESFVLASSYGSPVATLLYDVPAGFCGVIRGFSYNISNPQDLFGALVLSVVVEGRPSDSQQSLNFGTFINLTPCYEVADEGQTIGIRLELVGGASGPINGNFAIHGNVLPKRGTDVDTGLGSPIPATNRGLSRVFASLFRNPVRLKNGTR